MDIQSFADVPVTSDGVETVSFLDASDGLVNMFGTSPRAIAEEDAKHPLLKDLLGIGVFSFVQADLRANIGVRASLPFGPSVDARASQY